ncbi:TadE/TadG family type IV pilus assembly protein [Saccharopolyspora sp. 6M]|uniref:TadE/TadG family type IV pilus assembly protein n=1 Tax=Saccharopolyspora sp. 6M TaxID=2877237 RepID=UPI001CD4B953|nr:TadE/TadG family type IV pilus assembly protein [Saccharopolyspora sp. 6M]MCA1229549.1 pilus assembly protein [Saccharopolyspora sp. 6M]
MTVHTRHTCSDRGSETVETAVLAGLALVLLVSIVQAALWWHTRSLCQHAATTGLHAARAYNATPGAGEHAAADFLTRAPNAATDPTTSVETAAEAVMVRVSATAPRVLPIPGLEFRVTRTATAEQERFTTPGSRS